MPLHLTPKLFQAIDSEHQELERLYAGFAPLLVGESSDPALLGRRLAELAIALIRHFKHEESSGYFENITTLDARLSYEAEELHEEHGVLLGDREYLDDQLPAAADNPAALATLCREVGEFLEACRAHQRRETAIALEAILAGKDGDA